MPALIDARTETYNDIEQRIAKTVNAFRRRFGGDYYELIAQANLIYSRCYETFQPGRSAFGKRIRWAIWFGLLDAKLADDKRERRQKTERWIPEVLAELPEPSHYDMRELISLLSNDASFVVHTVLESDYDGWAADDDDEWHPRRQHCNSRLALVQFLSDRGWTGNRIVRAFDEIREAICN